MAYFNVIQRIFPANAIMRIITFELNLNHAVTSKLNAGNNVMASK